MPSVLSSRCRPMYDRWTAALVALLLALAALVITGSPASAQEPTGDVDEVVVSSESEGLATTLTLSFDQPISQEEADELQQELEAAEPSAARAAAVETLGCQRGLQRSDANGRLSLQFSCYPDRGSIAWGYTISAQVQAIVVGPVNETGWRHWVNSRERPRGAPHVVPANYFFHGTMTPVFVNEYVDYQDYMTFRHARGSGSLTVAGSVRLTY